MTWRNVGQEFRIAKDNGDKKLTKAMMFNKSSGVMFFKDFQGWLWQGIAKGNDSKEIPGAMMFKESPGAMFVKDSKGLWWQEIASGIEVENCQGKWCKRCQEKWLQVIIEGIDENGFLKEGNV